MSQNKQPRNINTVMTIRLLAIAYVLYMLYQVIMSYVEGGPESPSVGMLVAAIVLLGGGAALIGWLSWKEYQRCTEEAALLKAQEETARELETEEDSSGEQV